MSLFRRTPKAAKAAPIPWVGVVHASHQPEAELVVNLLRDGGIPAYSRRSAAFDVPDFLAVGARLVLVPADRLEDAKALLDPFEWRNAPGEDAP